jgi:hypothetical protein
LPKYPIIEYLDFGDMEDQIIDLLNTSPMYWNTHLFWDGSINYSYLQHDDDFKVQIDYSEVIARALETSALNSLDVISSLFHSIKRDNALLPREIEEYY